MNSFGFASADGHDPERLVRSFNHYRTAADPRFREALRTRILAAFNVAHPRILGALLEAMSHGIRNLATTTLSHSPRMVDFALWVSAAEPGLGWPKETFLSAYDDNRAEANQLALEASPITAPLFALLSQGPWQGTATALLKALAQAADDTAKHKPGWPQTETALAVTLRRLATSLRSAGIEVAFERKTDRRRTRNINLRFLPSAVSAPSAAIGGDEGDRCGMQGIVRMAGAKIALLEEAQRGLREIAKRAIAEGDYKAAIAAQNGLISIAKLTPDDGGVLERISRELEGLTDEQLTEFQGVAGERSTTTGSSGATPPADDQ